jgi:hypothetical protein
MNLAAFTFPFSLMFAIGLFIIGSFFTAIVFGIIAFILFIFGVYFGVIRITPLFNLGSSIVEFFWPGSGHAIGESIRKSFTVEYPDGEPARIPQIFIFHPHGVFSVANAWHSATKLSDWKTRPMKGSASSWLLWLPFLPELFEKMNYVTTDYDDMKSVLKGGESLSVCLGGVREIMYAQEGRMKLSILKKTGIFRMALEEGCPLVPVLTYGENELYTVLDNEWLTWVNKKLMAYGTCCPIPDWESCRRWFGILEKPLAEPVRTVVGSAIPVARRAAPTDTEISELREKYFVALRDLYRRTRPSHYADELEIV